MITVVTLPVEGLGGLLYFGEQIDPTDWRGLWFCADVYDLEAVGSCGMCLDGTGTWDDVTANKKYIEQFNFVFVVCADPSYRKTMVEELHKRLCMKILIASDKQFCGCKSVRELWSNHGNEGVKRLMMDYECLPAYGLVNIADVKQVDVTRMPRVLSGFPPIDRAIGGFLMGDCNVWTAKRGEGKSTLLSQLMIEAIDADRRVCAYSGELSKERFKCWMQLQAAGSEFITSREDAEADRTVYETPKHIQTAIDEWWNGRCYLYDNTIEGAHTDESILSLFRYAARQHGCDVFMVDNLMTTNFTSGSDWDFYRAQSAFVGKLVEFANQFGVCVHIVAHPKKTDSKGMQDADNVAGTAEITNRAANVFSLRRLPEAEAGNAGFDTCLHILKNRAYGNQSDIGLNFDPVSKRFSAPQSSTEKRYGWTATVQTEFCEMPDEQTPFDE